MYDSESIDVIIGQLRTSGADELREAGIESARLDADLLLAQALGWQREQLLSRSDQVVDAESERRYRAFIARRCKFEPFAYISGRKEFYGRDFLVSPAVLIPRPETELLVESAMEILKQLDPDEEILVIDIGTGSGAIVLTLLAEIQESCSFKAVHAVAVDRSEAALHVAEDNAGRMSLSEKVTFIESDLFGSIPLHDLHKGSFALIAANLPYVPEDQTLPPDVERYEPRSALRAGAKGMDLIERCVEQIDRLEPCGRGSALLEIGAGQSELFRELFGKRFEFRRDLQGIERVARCNYCSTCG